VSVFATLLALTRLTTGVAYIDLGVFNPILAIDYWAPCLSQSVVYLLSMKDTSLLKPNESIWSDTFVMGPCLVEMRASS
jgi:hypothetical protein